MAAKKTPAQVYARMTEIGYVQIRVTKTRIEWGEPALAHEDDECIALKRWVKKNYDAFAAYIRSLPRAAS